MPAAPVTTPSAGPVAGGGGPPPPPPPASPPAAPAPADRSPGRPRDPRVDEAVLAATRELLAEVGYRRLTAEEAARRAGVSRTTLRLRWKSKAELVFDAVAPDARQFQAPDGGSLEADLRACIDNAISFFRSAAVGAAFQGLIDDCRDQPLVRAALLEQVNTPTLLGYRTMVERAVARGEAAAGTDPATLLDIVAGAVLYRVTVSRLELGELTDELVELLSAGIRRKLPPAGEMPAPTT
jgi:AcrR family transcriptional regulator